jgi:hypothetical protein
VSSIFACGMFFGSALILTAFCIYYYVVRYMNLSPKPHDMREMFMYRFILFPIIMVLFVAINVRIWSLKGINYVFIFELDPRNHLSKWQFFLMPMVLYNMWAFSFFVYMWSIANDILVDYAWLHPASLTIVLITWLFLPLKLLGGGARYWVTNIYLSLTEVVVRELR